MNGSNIAAYTARFSDLALLYPGMVTPESKKVKRYIWGLTPATQGNILAAKPLTFSSTKPLAQTLINHGGHQDTMTVITEQPKESGSGMKSCEINVRANHRRSPPINNKKCQSTLLPFLLHFPLLKHLPADTLELSLGVKNATIIIMGLVRSCSALAATRSDTHPVSARHLHNQMPRPPELELAEPAMGAVKSGTTKEIALRKKMLATHEECYQWVRRRQ